MAHVTFIDGIANKPPSEVLLKVWRQALAHGDGLKGHAVLTVH